MTFAREIHLRRRPDGMPVAADFELKEVELPTLQAGEILVRNEWMSVDPYMRGRMTDRKSYVPPFKLGHALDGGAVGEVVESRNDRFKPGDSVTHMRGWRDFAVSDGRDAEVLPADDLPSRHYLNLLGIPGLTAYFGLFDIAGLKEGETIFVSAAAGAVGSTVCQMAKRLDCKVVGSCGSDEKGRWLSNTLNVDQIINYKTSDDLTQALAAAAPDGVDVYFENVGGAHLQAALANMNQFGRIPVCGMISDYNSLGDGGKVSNLFEIVSRRLTLRGFILMDFIKEYARARSQIAEWVRAGELQSTETVYEGIDSAVDAFLGLFTGANTGKMLVKLR